MAFMQPPGEILWTNAVSQTQGVKILCYARSGVGKTFLIKTAPKPFILSSENGLLSLSTANPIIPFAIIRTLKDLDGWINWFNIRGDDERVQTVCVDSLTDIADSVIENELKKSKDGRKAYGEMYSQVMERFKWLRDLRYRHLYAITQQEAVKDEVSGMTFWGPSFPGNKLSNKTPYLYDETFQLIIANDKTRWLRTRADAQNEGKDRSGILDEFEPANLGHIINKIMKHAAQSGQ